MTVSTIRELPNGSYAVTLVLDAEAMQFATQTASAFGLIDAEDYLQAVLGMAMVNEMAEAEMRKVHADVASVVAFDMNDDDIPF